MTNLETIANLVRACATCGVLHSVGYRCATERKISRFYPQWASTPTVALAKGTR